MANLKLEHIYKVYPNGTKAVNDFSLDVKNGEFIVFVGPSGCGKSTTLRMIAGLEEITAGELYIDSNIVNDMEPKDRDIAMVFQNYALYPHMTVYENMAFGLRLRHVPEDIIQEKVLWAADILGITEYLDRKPRNMSGGQRQRVSLGRAILRDPKVMLLDEPLSNLDAKLRAQMRTEIAKLHQKLKTTFVYVTHDQTEAMTLGDRVVVMKKGRIQQVDTPKNLYNYPANIFVAGFIGTPQMNFFDCSLKKDGDKVNLHIDCNNQDIDVDYNHLIKVLPQFLDGEHKLCLGVRCENVHVVSKDTPNAIKVKISHFEELGSECLIYGSLADEGNIEDTNGQIIVKVFDVEGLKAEQDIYVTFDMDHTYFFDKDTENTIVPRIPEYNSFVASINNNNLHVLKNVIALPEALKNGDITDAELRVPVDAVNFTDDGFEAEVIDVEKIGDVQLVHLMTDNRVFFAKNDADVKKGDKVHVTFDFTRLTLINEGEMIFQPIAHFDSLYANFYNYETVVAQDNDPEFVKFRDDKIASAADYVDAQIDLENQDYEKKSLDLGNRDINAEAAKAVSEYQALKMENGAKAKEIKQATSKEIKELKSSFAKAKKEEKIKNDMLFREKKEKEVQEYKEFMANNKDKITRKRRTDEYHIFKDNFQTDKESTYTRTLNRLTQDNETAISKCKSERRRKLDLLNKEVADKKHAVALAKNPKKALDKEHAQKISELQNKREEAVKRAGFVFFFRFDGGYYGLTSDIISNKLIQGLGTRVFSRQFRIDMPHDAYTLSNKENAFRVIVESNLDYGSKYFVRCHFQDDNGNTQFLFLASDKPYEIGQELALDFDVSKSQITETDMNIRLY